MKALKQQRWPWCVGIGLHFGVRPALDQGSLLLDFSQLEYALLADGGHRVQEGGREYKVTAKDGGTGELRSAGRAGGAQKAVAAKPAGILISVADAAVLQPGIDAAMAAGIPVITVDSDASRSHRLYFIGTNNHEAGQLGGKRVVEKLGGKGNVVFFTITGQPNLEDRLDGFKAILSAHPLRCKPHRSKYIHIRLAVLFFACFASEHSRAL